MLQSCLLLGWSASVSLSSFALIRVTRELGVVEVKGVSCDNLNAPVYTSDADLSFSLLFIFAFVLLIVYFILRRRLFTFFVVVLIMILLVMSSSWNITLLYLSHLSTIILYRLYTRRNKSSRYEIHTSAYNALDIICRYLHGVF